MKTAGRMAQVVERLPASTRPCVQAPVPQKKKKVKTKQCGQILTCLQV
jgi:hypothetical protein